MKEYCNDIVKFANILLPKKDVDLQKWSTIACDQFSSEKGYWQDVKAFVGDKPSTLNMILPECYLSGDNSKYIKSINSSMQNYLDKGLFAEYKDSAVLVVRTFESGKKRLGLLLALDLECYDYSKGSVSLIRATEGTVIERIPPRVEIRRDAPLELPHIIVLIDDAKELLIEPLFKRASEFNKVYDTPLMQGGGKIEGYLLDEKAKDSVINALAHLFDTAPVDKNKNKIMFAVGDGNHSLATAKQCYELLKKEIGEHKAKSHPARYALVEIENIYSDAIEFEPIHRVLFDLAGGFSAFDNILSALGLNYSATSHSSLLEARAGISSVMDGFCSFALFDGKSYASYQVLKTDDLDSSAKVIEKVIDYAVSNKVAGGVDYIHSFESVENITKSSVSSLGIIMPPINKSNFFKEILTSPYPRKTFSIGNPREKRYYMECRKIK